MKRILSLILIVALSLSLCTPVFADGQGSGIGSQMREEATIKYAKDSGLYLGDDMNPDKIVTRAEVAGAVGRAVGVAKVAEATTFMDVDKSNPYFLEICALDHLGIMKGSNGYFRPDAPITREEFAVIIDRVYTQYFDGFSEEFDFYPELFVDSALVSDWAKEAVAHVKEAGIVMARKGRYFAPKEYLTLSELAYGAKQIKFKNTKEDVFYVADTEVNPRETFDVYQSGYLLSTGTAGFGMLARFDGAPGDIYVSRTTSSNRSSLKVSGEKWTYDPVPIARVSDPTGKVIARVSLYDVEDGKMAKIITIPQGPAGIYTISVVGGRTGDLIEFGINKPISWGVRGEPFFETTKDTPADMYFWVPKKVATVRIGSRGTFSIKDVNGKVVGTTAASNTTYAKNVATMDGLTPETAYCVSRATGATQSMCIAGAPKLLSPTAEMAADLKGGIVYAEDGTQCMGPLQARARNALLKLYRERGGDFTWVDDHPAEIPTNLISEYAEADSMAKLVRMGNTELGFYDPVEIRTPEDVVDSSVKKTLLDTTFEYMGKMSSYAHDVGPLYMDNSQVNYMYGEKAFIDHETMLMLHAISGLEDIGVMSDSDHSNLGHHYYYVHSNFALERITRSFLDIKDAIDSEYAELVNEGVLYLGEKQMQARGNGPTNQYIHGVISAMYLYLISGQDHYHESFKRGIQFALSFNKDKGWSGIGQAPAGYFIEQGGCDGNYEHMNSTFFGHIHEYYCLSEHSDPEIVEFIHNGVKRGFKFHLMFKGYQKEGYTTALTYSHASRTDTSIQSWGGQPGYSELRAYFPEARRINESEVGYGEYTETAIIYPHLLRESWSSDILADMWPKYEDNFNGTNRNARGVVRNHELKYRDLMEQVEPVKAPVDEEVGMWTEDVEGVASIKNKGVYLVTFYNSSIGSIGSKCYYGGPSAVSTEATAGVVTSRRHLDTTNSDGVIATSVFGKANGGEFWVSGKEMLNLEVVEEGKSFKTVGDITGSTRKIEWLYEMTEDGVAVSPSITGMAMDDEYWFNLPLTDQKNATYSVEDGKIVITGYYNGKTEQSIIEWEPGFEYEYIQKDETTKVDRLRIKLHPEKPLKVNFRVGNVE